ncbi:MAG TPA: PilZ domain-containing protein, partial [Halioglobus sp.]
HCNVEDVSYGGFRVKVESELTVGAILAVCVELPAVEEPFYMAAEVKWCRPGEDGQGGWLAGFEVLRSSGTDIESWRQLLQHI